MATKVYHKENPNEEPQWQSLCRRRAKAIQSQHLYIRKLISCALASQLLKMRLCYLFLFVLCTPTSLFAQTTLETLKCPAFIEKSLSSIRSQLNCTCSFSDTISSLQARVSSLSANIKKLVEHPLPLLFPSCQAILSKWPKSPSGYYSIVDEDEQTRQVYCHMGAMCGKGGGWMRVANLNMKEESNRCPSGFRLFSTNGDFVLVVVLTLMIVVV